MNTYNNLSIQKISSLALTIIAIFAMNLTQKLPNIALVMLIPFLFDGGHFLLATIYQKKSNQIDSFFWKKVFLVIILGSILLTFGNTTFNRWLIYSFGSWHVLNDERYTLRNSGVHFHFTEVLIPAAGYIYLIYLKFFNQLLSPHFFILYFTLVAFYMLWIISVKKGPLLKYYFLSFSVINGLGMFYYQHLTLLMVTLFYIYFHYISFYIYFFQKIESKKEFSQLVFVVNAIFLTMFASVFVFDTNNNLLVALSQSFLIPGWLLLHIVTTLRKEEVGAWIPRKFIE